MNNSKSLSFPIILDRVEAYDASTLNCYAFRRGTDSIEGHVLAVGNMVSGLPFDVEGVTFQNTESAYIAGMFSDDTESDLELLRSKQIFILGKLLSFHD